MNKRKTGIIIAVLLVSLLTGCGATEENPDSVVGLEGIVQSLEVETADSGTNAENMQGSDTKESESDNAGVSKADADDAEAHDSGAADKETTEQEITGAGDQTGDAEMSSPEEEQPAEISLIMVGDVLLHTPVAQSGKKEDGTYEFNHLFAHVKDTVSAADLALVNQEVIIGGSELGVSGYPAFNAPYELGDALVDAGFNVILHATNHAMDKGKKGILNCLNYWREQHPERKVLGIYDSEEDADEIFVYEQDGMKLAILNFTYGTNGIALPGDMPYAVSLLEEAKVKAALQKANELADFVIVAPHWGTEYVLEQTSYQKKWAKLFAENGVDLVLGTHPHVIEPVVWWGTDENGSWSEKAEEPEDGEKMLVYYSLGNFVNWTSGTGAGVANRMVGGMAKVTIAKSAEGQPEISKWSVMPLVSHEQKGFGGVTVYPLSEYTAELGEQNEIRSQDSAFSYEYCVKLSEKVFGSAAE